MIYIERENYSKIKIHSLFFSPTECVFLFSQTDLSFPGISQWSKIDFLWGNFEAFSKEKLFVPGTKKERRKRGDLEKHLKR